MTLRLAGFVASVMAGALVAMPAPEAHIVVVNFQGTVQHAAPEPAAPLPAERAMRRFAPMVEAASRAHGIDHALVHAVILAESAYDPNAISEAGAQGLMQLMPETAREHGVENLLDPASNVKAGVRHLKGLLAQFDGDVELALAAYNAGAGAVQRAGNRIPSIRETEAFVPKVLDYHRRLKALAAHSPA
jgi:soluble lytic murein transglycosylase-like protein